MPYFLYVYEGKGYAVAYLYEFMGAFVCLFVLKSYLLCRVGASALIILSYSQKRTSALLETQNNKVAPIEVQNSYGNVVICIGHSIWLYLYERPHEY